MIFLFGTITGCNNMYEKIDRMLYWPEGIDKSITNKTSTKPFSDLDNPIVVAMPLYESHNFLGVSKWGYTTMQVGNILVVFDTKSESVYDWAFTTGSCGWSGCQMLMVNGNWWINGENGEATRLNPETGGISIYKHGVESHIFCEAAEGEKFILSSSSKYDSVKKKYITEYYLFDTEKCELEEKSYSIETDEYLDINVYGDKEDNFWFCKYNDNIQYLESFPQKNNEIKIEYNEKFHVLEVDLITDKMIFINAYGTSSEPNPRMYSYDIKSKGCSTVDVSSIISSGYNIFDGVQIKDNIYFICLSKDIGKDLRIAKYNIENNKLELQDEILKYNYTGWPYVCDSKIFLLDCWNMQQIKYEWYDTETGEFSEPRVISLEEIIK